jgi:AcrR family transcriptional regulator
MSQLKPANATTTGKPDPRVSRTKRVLREAFLELVLEQGFEAVRISEVITRAGVNRATFYRHYRSKRDLLRSWTQEVGHLLDAQVGSLEDPRVYAGSAEYLPAIVTTIFEHVALHDSYYRLMLGRNGLSGIANDVELQICAFLERHANLLELTPNGVPAGMQMRAYAAQFVGILKWWLEQPTPPLAQQVAAWAWDLFTFPEASSTIPVRWSQLQK